MKNTPKIPKNETERVITLEACNILDMLTEEEFEHIAGFASQICQIPVSINGSGNKLTKL